MFDVMKILTQKTRLNSLRAFVDISFTVIRSKTPNVDDEEGMIYGRSSYLETVGWARRTLATFVIIEIEKTNEKPKKLSEHCPNPPICYMHISGMYSIF